MKNRTISFLVISGLMIMLASAHIYLVNASTSTNSSITSCAGVAKSSETADDILKIEIPASKANNRTNKSWIFISNDAKKEFDSIIAKRKDVSFSIFVSGYGWRGPSIGLVESDKTTEGTLVKTNGLAFVLSTDIMNTAANYKGIYIDYVDNLWLDDFSLIFMN